MTPQEPGSGWTSGKVIGLIACIFGLITFGGGSVFGLAMTAMGIGDPSDLAVLFAPTIGLTIGCFLAARAIVRSAERSGKPRP